MLDEAPEDIAPATLRCLNCNYAFDDRSDQVAHYKSDWHRYNLKLKLLKREILNEDEFNNLSGEV